MLIIKHWFIMLIIITIYNYYKYYKNSYWSCSLHFEFHWNHSHFMPTCADMACPLSRWAWAAVTSGGSRGRGGSGWSWWELGSRDASPLQCWGNTTGARLVQKTTYFTTCTWHMWHIIRCIYIYMYIYIYIYVYICIYIWSRVRCSYPAPVWVSR